MIKLADRFMLEREIGSGGMARVFLSRDEVLGRAVAVKILRHGYGESDVGARFRREGRTAASLSHPNIVQVYDAGEAEFEGRESSYIVMEYISGGDLKNLIDEEGTVPSEKLMGIGAAVASGLAHAHERGVIHRDIKPHNIMLDERGRPRLTDFGIARALDTTQATRTGAFLGTALYSSPEQLQGENVTPKSDVYSLGATLYQAATGEPPFTGSPISVASQHVSKPPPPPAELNSAIDPRLQTLILACLAKDPDERPTAEEVRSRLTNAEGQNGQTSAYIAPPARPTREQPTEAAGASRGQGPRHGRNRVLIALIVLLAVLALIAALAIPSFFGGDGQSGNNKPPSGKKQQNAQQKNPQPKDQQNPPSKDTPDNNAGNPTPAPPATTPTPQPTTPQPTTPQTTPSAPTEPTQSDASDAEAAAQTIRDHYAVAASDNYQDAWNYLSSNYQQEIGSQSAWTDQFQTLESVTFTSGPTAQVNGDTATVSFSTRAVHTDRVDNPSLTATLVRENGEWKIDSLG